MFGRFFLVLIFIFHFPKSYGDQLHRFSLPFFNERGTKICDIFGRRADLSDNKSLKLFDINIQTFSKTKDDPSHNISIMSDQAMINPLEHRASGNGFIVISNREFSASGNDWQFLGDIQNDSKNFTINKNVQVFFEKLQHTHD
ncbi:MAG: hypothetical protein LBS71_01925 [Puniceicoccales bacterium]|jgi:hypothetical protein|nr:hypothetical protein [Puniceicoccales bacterium]